jgi:hypothetical protein
LTEQDELSCITPVLIFPDEGSFDGFTIVVEQVFRQDTVTWQRFGLPAIY